MRQRDTDIELDLRRMLHSFGLRFRLQKCVLAGCQRRPDIVFPAAKVAVFVDGCFWHWCPRHRTFPKANRAWWVEKLMANRRRDRDTDRKFRAAGWLPLRVWEHEKVEVAAARIMALVRSRRSDGFI